LKTVDAGPRAVPLASMTHDHGDRTHGHDHGHDPARPDEPAGTAASTDGTTPALEALEAAGVAFTVVRTQIAHDAEESAQLQGIELGALLRSILVRRAADDYVFVLVPGGRRFDWPKLRAHLGTNRLSLPDAEEARSITGYERGAITPFGALHAWPVVADASIEGRTVVAIGGGARGVNVHIAPVDLVEATGAVVVDISAPEQPTA
jgi:Cys-tRNA(Pro)/Cys-tRNA(Cys) deacylase